MKQIIREQVIQKLYHSKLLNEALHLIEKSITVDDDIFDLLSRVKNPFTTELYRFLNGNKIKDNANIDYLHYYPEDGKYFRLGYTDGKGNDKEMKISLSKLLKYLGGEEILKKAKGYEIEELISILKNESNDNFKLLKGSDICKAYQSSNCDSNKVDSCMTDEPCSKFDLYTNNPNVVQLLVLINPENNKITGRALIWNLSDGTKFMDKIYTGNENKSFFYNYASQNNIKYGITPHQSIYLDAPLTIKSDNLPFLDTFVFYNPNENKLNAESGELILRDVEEVEYGRFIEGVGLVDDAFVSASWDGETEVYINDPRVVTIDVGRYQGEYAYKNEVVFDYEDNFILIEEAIKIEKGDEKGKYAHEDSVVEDYKGNNILSDEAVVLDHGKHEDEYCHIDDCLQIALKNDDEWYTVSASEEEYYEQDENVTHIRSYQKQNYYR